MKFMLIVTASFLAGFLLGDAHGYIEGIQIAEALQWAN
jgi:hypothetical protein